MFKTEEGFLFLETFRVTSFRMTAFDEELADEHDHACSKSFLRESWSCFFSSSGEDVQRTNWSWSSSLLAHSCFEFKFFSWQFYAADAPR